MKRALFGVMLAVLLVGLSSRAFATTTDQLRITSGGLTATITDNGSCVGSACTTISVDLVSAPGTDSVTGTINGWNLSIVSGTTNSPGVIPFGLITSLTASCLTASCTGGNTLDIQYSDNSFTTAPSAFMTTYSGTIGGSGSTIESAYFSNSNTNFATTNLIGTVGPFSAPFGAGTAIGGVGAVAPYSLTLDQIFSSGGANSSFSVGASVTAAPEPASLTLVGTGLIGLAGLRRRKLLQA